VLAILQHSQCQQHLLWRGLEDPFYLFDAHYCTIAIWDTAKKHPVPDPVKLQFVIFDIWAFAVTVDTES